MTHRHNFVTAGHDDDGRKWAMCNGCEAVTLNGKVVAAGLDNLGPTKSTKSEDDEYTSLYAKLYARPDKDLSIAQNDEENYDFGDHKIKDSEKE